MGPRPSPHTWSEAPAQQSRDLGSKGRVEEENIIDTETRRAEIGPAFGAGQKLRGDVLQEVLLNEVP